MVPQWVIERKRDGAELSETEIRDLVDGFTAGRIPDYQMAAWAMAVFFRGLTADETRHLTDAMLRSGETLDFPGLALPTADKHSTGGIGDKVSLVLAPLAACCGMAVPMIAGRGLGLTGGTLDKLESIPGFRTGLDETAIRRAMSDIGCCIAGATERLAPADRKLYALRDVTGTVPSIPLITASILSKKLAEGAQTLVFDVKCGRGAFMRTRSEARQLAESLLTVTELSGRRAAALITAMERPLGATIGNSLEVAEAVSLLTGGGPPEVRELTLEMAGHMAVLSGAATSLGEARTRLASRLDDGSAAERFAAMIRGQGGDSRIVSQPGRLPAAAAVVDVRSPSDGFVADIDAEQLGRVALLLGAGRCRTGDAIDPAAGIDAILPQGTPVTRGERLMRLHAASAEKAAACAAKAAAAVTIAAEAPPRSPLILDVRSPAA